jgi:histone deacetylase 1/2
MDFTTNHKRVAYYYDSDVPNKHYGPGHPMKPQRLRLTHELILSYGLFRQMDILQSRAATSEELARYHAADYVEFLERITPKYTGTKSNDERGVGSKENAEIVQLASAFNIANDGDCPLFDGLYEFCQLTCGASIDGASRLNSGESNICINWSGGLHHAKKGEASGFCYANDIVLGILELLRYHARVLYIDIDIHHGDGVEEAFYFTNRVMTCSFHKFADGFFPGTGDLNDIGDGEGRGYSVNFPLKDGLSDTSFVFCFKPIIQKIMDVYDPGAIVLQCGADSLAGDQIGMFELSVKGHAAAVEFIKSFHKPTLILGGGGYTINNVSRCWAYETSVLIGQEVPDPIPNTDRFYEYYAPNYTIHGLNLTRRNQLTGKLSGSAVATTTSTSNVNSTNLINPNLTTSSTTTTTTLNTTSTKSSSSSSTGGGGNVPSSSSHTNVLGGAGGSFECNSIPYLTYCRDAILAHLNELRGPPSVGIQDVPPSWALAIRKRFEEMSLNNAEGDE